MTSRGGSALRPGIPPPGSAARPGTALAKPSLTTPSADLVSELKVAAVVYDVGSGAKDATSVKDGLERSRRMAEETLRNLAGRSAALLRELEAHYYASVAGVGVDNTGRVGEF
ncbi:hypothetical protein I4F81_002393 [Pyropia yezoensis]|uniref:Uncharacterized protein n=1 Tax=Pyropia yezoensis TaxID=2788 RepID=A0ACC3BPC0_PYRYE|nr:hypothetical protein I4F81_002393 [Neopyropia yezoensis]